MCVCECDSLRVADTHTECFSLSHHILAQGPPHHPGSSSSAASTLTPPALTAITPAQCSQTPGACPCAHPQLPPNPQPSPSLQSLVHLCACSLPGPPFSVPSLLPVTSTPTAPQQAGTVSLVAICKWCGSEGRTRRTKAIAISTPSSYSHHFPHTSQLAEGMISCLLGSTSIRVARTPNTSSPPQLPLPNTLHGPGAV